MALETATVIPRSLNDPVGLTPSFLINTSQLRPTRALSLGEKTSGVFPSPKDTTVLHGGRKSRYRSITPLPCFISPVPSAIFIRNQFERLSSRNCVMLARHV